MIPRPAVYVLSVLIPEQSLRDAVIGDLVETYGMVEGSAGAAAAKRTLWREIACSAPYFVRATMTPFLFCRLLSGAGGIVCRTRGFLKETAT
jgi:hypothetical protein